MHPKINRETYSADGDSYIVDTDAATVDVYTVDDTDDVQWIQDYLSGDLDDLPEL